MGRRVGVLAAIVVGLVGAGECGISPAAPMPPTVVTLAGGALTPAGPPPAPPPAPPLLSVGAPPTPAPRPAPAVASRRPGLPPGAEAMVSVARIGLHAAVYAGGQAEIDRGHVAHFWAAPWRLPVEPGAIGTYWLAAHHLTHGEPFARLPELRAGDEVDITTARGVVRYLITGREVVGTQVPFTTVYGSDLRARRIVLQTCVSESQRLLVHGQTI